jgi:hypothetical protein
MHMKQTTFETFTELAQRSTFVPVVKELVADLLTRLSCASQSIPTTRSSSRASKVVSTSAGTPSSARTRS